jgi:hypothetical protein
MVFAKSMLTIQRQKDPEQEQFSCKVARLHTLLNTKLKRTTILGNPRNKFDKDLFSTATAIHF